MTALPFSSLIPLAAPRAVLNGGRVPVRTLVAAVEILLVLALAERASALVTGFIAAPVSGAGPLSHALPPPAAAPWSPADAIPDFDPFHRDAAPVVAIETAAPDTLLDLTLFGVRMAAAGGGRASAIIRTPDLRQDAFGVGDEITDGVILDAVHRDRVTLLRAGVRESLWLDGADRTAAAQPVASQPATSRRVSGGTGSTSGAMRVPAAAMRALVADFQGLVRPHVVDGGMAGLSIVPTADPGLLAPLGLKPEDLVLAVGDIGLTSSQNLETALEYLAEARRLRITLQRSGAPQTLDLELEGSP